MGLTCSKGGTRREAVVVGKLNNVFILTRPGGGGRGWDTS